MGGGLGVSSALKVAKENRKNKKGHGLLLFQKKTWPWACLHDSIEGNVGNYINLNTLLGYSFKTIPEEQTASDDKNRRVRDKIH